MEKSPSSAGEANTLRYISQRAARRFRCLCATLEVPWGARDGAWYPVFSSIPTGRKPGSVASFLWLAGQATR